MEFDKKELSEDDVRTKYIDPAIEKAGWNMVSLSGTGVVRENYPIKKGKIIIKGNICEREEEGRADYVLFQKPGYNKRKNMLII